VAKVAPGLTCLAEPVHHYPPPLTTLVRWSVSLALLVTFAGYAFLESVSYRY
jgi:hypothetical protein